MILRPRDRITLLTALAFALLAGEIVLVHLLFAESPLGPSGAPMLSTDALARPHCQFDGRCVLYLINQEGPMDKLLRDPFTLIVALTVIVLAVEIAAVRWL
ncbi:hypothetical protein [Reyranella sp.]|uniref:hypothetical protein n=1 Tax=Reyranella sp. TaxID=1929291 RepID=UPI003D121A29